MTQLYFSLMCGLDFDAYFLAPPGSSKNESSGGGSRGGGMEVDRDGVFESICVCRCNYD